MEALLPQTRTPHRLPWFRGRGGKPQIYDLNILEIIHSACPATANIQRPRENTGSILECGIAAGASTPMKHLENHQDASMASCCLSFPRTFPSPSKTHGLLQEVSFFRDDTPWAARQEQSSPCEKEEFQLYSPPGLHQGKNFLSRIKWVWQIKAWGGYKQANKGVNTALATITSWEVNKHNEERSGIDLWSLLDISTRTVEDTQKELEGN